MSLPEIMLIKEDPLKSLKMVKDTKLINKSNLQPKI